MNKSEYNNTLRSTPWSRACWETAAAFVNLAMRGMMTDGELRECADGPVTALKARAFATLTNLALAAEVAMKGVLEGDILAEAGEEPLNRRRGHDLYYLFHRLPGIEKAQMRACVEGIMGVDAGEFDAMLDSIRLGFVEWRYFYEAQYAGKRYDYRRIVFFLFSMTYYFLSNAGREDALEESGLKKAAYIGDSGELREKRRLEEEFRDACQAALRDGNGGISESDAQWQAGIWAQCKDAVARIGKVG